MPKFTSTTRRLQVGHGQYVGVLFVIPVIITIQKHRFLITIGAPFLEEISGMAITKLLDTKSHIDLKLKLKFIRNRATLKVTNSTQEKGIFNPEHVVGIVDLRSLGYYKIKQGIL